MKNHSYFGRVLRLPICLYDSKVFLVWTMYFQETKQRATYSRGWISWDLMRECAYGSEPRPCQVANLAEGRPIHYRKSTTVLDFSRSQWGSFWLPPSFEYPLSEALIQSTTTTITSDDYGSDAEERNARVVDEPRASVYSAYCDVQLVRHIFWVRGPSMKSLSRKDDQCLLSTSSIRMMDHVCNADTGETDARSARI